MNNLDLFYNWHDLKKNNKNIDDFCLENKIALSRDEKISLISEITKKDVFFYSTFLTNSLPIIADSDEQFISLLDDIVKAVNGDPAIGWFEMALTRIGETDHQLGMEIARKMKNIDSLFPFSIVPIAGIGRIDYDKIEHIVNEMLESQDSKEVINGLRIIRISFQNKEPNKKYNILSKIETAKKLRLEQINIELVLMLLQFHKSESIFCQANILELIRTNENLKGIISRNIWVKPIEDASKAMELLQECYKSTNHNIRRSVFYPLSHYVKTGHKEIMEIIRIELENKGHPYGELEHLIQELGRHALFDTLDDFENWLKTENPYLKLSIPRFVKLLIPNDKRLAVFPYIEKWSQENYCLPNLFHKIHKQIIASCYLYEEERKSCLVQDGHFINNSKILLSNLVTKSGMNPAFLIQGEDNEIFQCAKLINGLEFYFKDLNYDAIISHLDFFPYLKNSLTQNWVLDKKKENNRTNLLLRVLEREFPDESKINEILAALKEVKTERERDWQRLRLINHVYDFLYVRNIELNIQRLTYAGLGMVTHFRSKLQNDLQVDDTISEINLLGTIVQHYELRLEFPVGDKNIDSLIEIDGQKLYLEVINPAEFAPLELFEGEVFSIPNRIKNKILDKCERQFSKVEKDIPVILAIDVDRTDVDCESIEDALHGSMQYTFRFDTKTGEDRGGYASRKDNSIHKSKTASDVLSAALCFKSELFSDMNFHITGKLIHNPNAANYLLEHISKRIEEIIVRRD